MRVLVLNCGSSSLKFRLIEMPVESEIAGGEAQRIGPTTAEPSRIVYRVRGREQSDPVDMRDHAEAFEQVMRRLTARAGLSPDAVGHRVVHGGPLFTHPTVLDRAAVARLDEVRDMAPLHNPPAMALIHSCTRRYPDLPQVAVFDTAFHATIPEHARTYALPAELREDMGLRKYGFHGTSHRYVAEEAARLLGRPLERLNAVSCHLGSGGASLCAIVKGRSVDNTMGYTPLQGLMMSTRSGDLDPAIVMDMLARSMGDAATVEEHLNKRSGVLGVSGISGDVRDVFAAMADGRCDAERPTRAAEAYLWRIRKYLGAYLTVVGRPDAVIFTDTIGETSPYVRWAACADMGAFGLRIDEARNRRAADLPVDVAADDSRVRILVIHTNEELAIARRVHETLTRTAPATVSGGPG